MKDFIHILPAILIISGFIIIVICSFVKEIRKKQPLRYCEKLIEVKELMKAARTDSDNVNVWNELMNLYKFADKDPDEVKELIKNWCKTLKV